MIFQIGRPLLARSPKRVTIPTDPRPPRPIFHFLHLKWSRERKPRSEIKVIMKASRTAL
jgi:hypothetical protein